MSDRCQVGVRWVSDRGQVVSDGCQMPGVVVLVSPFAIHDEWGGDMCRTPFHHPAVPCVCHIQSSSGVKDDRGRLVQLDQLTPIAGAFEKRKVLVAHVNVITNIPRGLTAHRA